MMRFLIYFLWFYLLVNAVSLQAAVVLQFHHIGEDTPRSTSASEKEFRQHLDWLKENNFKVISLQELVERRKQKKLDEFEKLAAITFDDQGSSICETAWPILKSYKYPFTIFVNTETMGKGISSLCSWEQLKTMFDSGLLTVGNHGHRHLHMLDKRPYKNQQQWEQLIREDILQAQKNIDGHLGEQPKLFAYPYGESNEELELLVANIGYVSFGQQSGAIGNNSNVNLLPRFPLSGQFANRDKLADKLNSLPFPIQEVRMSKHPIKKSSNENPPSLELTFEKDFNSPVQCYLGNGTKVTVEQQGNKIIVKSPNALGAGRSRYNCTAGSKYSGRYYWFSYQWLIEN